MRCFIVVFLHVSKRVLSRSATLYRQKDIKEKTSDGNIIMPLGKQFKSYSFLFVNATPIETLYCYCGIPYFIFPIYSQFQEILLNLLGEHMEHQFNIRSPKTRGSKFNSKLMKLNIDIPNFG